MALIFRRKKIWAEIEAEMRAKRDAEIADGAPLAACEHPRAEFRKLKTSNGVFQLRKQCLDCGELVGGAAKRDSVADFDALPFVDEIARQKSQNRWQDRQSLYAKHDEERQRAFWAYYNEHLRSPEWREKCALKMARADEVCEGCGKNRARHIHHRTYENLGDEFLFELVALCLDCHQKIHPHREIA